MSAHLSSRRSSPKSTYRSSPSRVIYDRVTSQILEALEAGTVPWRRPWPENGLPCNAISGRLYHGVNFFLLGMSRYQDHRWLTYMQAGQLGGHVKPGEKATLVVFWKRWEVETPDPATGQTRKERVPLLRHYSVFNAAQCEGLPLQELTLRTRPQNERIEAAEALVRAMPSPPQYHEGCKQACYYPLIDVVQMPALASFVSPDDYYATLFHELGHATGHESRLSRPGVIGTPKFGSADYSREELVAELTSAYCCAGLGLDNSLLANSASYIDGWIHTLRSDPKAMITAASQAQRAADYLRGIGQSEHQAEKESSEPEAAQP